MNLLELRYKIHPDDFPKLGLLFDSKSFVEMKLTVDLDSNQIICVNNCFVVQDRVLVHTPDNYIVKSFDDVE